MCYAFVAQLVEHTTDNRVVIGSNPIESTIYKFAIYLYMVNYGGLAAVGRAPVLQAGCHRFDSDIFHHTW